MSAVEVGIAAALDADDEARLRAIASSVDWAAEDPASANRILQRIALYGHSGRTERYRDVVEQLVASGVAPNLASCALLQANERAERFLADSPSSVFDIDEDGATPLHHAAERGNAPLAARLCELGAPVDAVDGRGETPLARALHAGPWKTETAHAVIRVLRDHGASLDLVTLAAMGDTDGLIEALDAGASVDETDQRGRTPLFVAARNNHREAVQALLARGADPNVPATDGQTPLSSACLHTLSQECDTEIVRLLVRHGAPVTIEAAIVLEDLDALRRFVADDPALLDGQHHDSPLGYAIHAWRPASLSCLVQSGAKPNADNWGTSSGSRAPPRRSFRNSKQSADRRESPMTSEVELVDVDERTIAAIKARLAMADIPDKIFPLMDRVWTFIRGNGIEGFGHNVWLYGPPADGQVDVEIGVQVPEPFQPVDDVACSHTPAGRAAHAVHFGDYPELPGVHMAVTSWCRQHGHALAGRSWEVYGDWEDDPAKRRTDVYHLIDQ